MFLLSSISFFVGFLAFNSVVINEIAWMGSELSPNDEWIELYNPTDNTIDLTGWSLITKDKTPKIKIKGEIKPHSFYLLERTDDYSVADIQADLIYKGGLSNKGEFLQLFDDKNNLIDEVDASMGWIFGDNKTKQTMEKAHNLRDWQTSEKSGGTPKSENSKIEDKKIETSQGINSNTKSFDNKSFKSKIPKNFLFSFLIAIILAIFSGIFALILKNKGIH